MHGAPGALKDPAGQAAQTYEPFLEYVPAAHNEQAGEPDVPEYVFGGQNAQDDCP